MSTKKSVVIENHSNVFKEFKATAVAITPGMLIERTSTADTVQAHSTAGGRAQRIFPKEDEHQGNGIDTAYAVSATIPLCWYPGSGDIVNALLANGETAVIGSKLVSDGAGRLKVATPDSISQITEEDVICIAIEAVDMSDSSGADPSARIEVEII